MNSRAIYNYTEAEFLEFVKKYVELKVQRKRKMNRHG
ncbi:TPA: hypothetical protein MBE66_005484 [Klebsiella pneumoniae]|nr:bacteriocin immunity protein [Klebsiella pneumoniae]EKV5710889.1 bacteriocin immunity protein [Klebsiella pneumoniae]EKV5874092.1 bacteriocin immunity protein [Klebsiella pneumoniae]EKW2074156.1 bacteriocin immunity protein [Klebsiella pneumoniae]EKW5805221.1 bacteriocin immunity protein [Klebsiella pneumoniae]